MKNNRVLITGGAGFIGVAVAKLLVAEGCSVLLFDNLSAQIHGAIPDMSALQSLPRTQVDVMRGDVTRDADWTAALENVQTVVHLAAETGTAQSMYEISRYTEINAGGTARLLDHLANHRHDVRKIVLASSRSVYGEGAYRCRRCGPVYPPTRGEDMLRRGEWQPRCPGCKNTIEETATSEAAKTAPASIYAATKLAQEHLVRVAAQALGIPAIIYRFQNVYGEGQSLKNPYTGILSIFSNQLRLGKTIQLYEDGEESRDFVHVSDVARAVGLAITSDSAEGTTLNVGSGQPTSVREIALLLADRFGVRTPPVISGQYRLGDVRHGYADLTSLRACLQFTPLISLDEGLTRFVEWVKSQPEEPDRLDGATQELVARGLMPGHLSADIAHETSGTADATLNKNVRDDLPDESPDQRAAYAQSKRASV
jgi:dTDP-L-rhamnose 4-epimerase